MKKNKINIIGKIKNFFFPFYRKKEIKEIFKILNEGQPSKQRNAMFVGGCVRNFLENEKIDDIDIATIFSPNELKKKFQDTDIKIVETGIEHGSVTLIKENYKVEITTLRRDIKTDGRHAEIDYTNSWQEDSDRRDFTINSIYLSEKGKVFDPQMGSRDLKNKIVKFIGDPNLRITEDYLRILRLIRFSIMYNSTPDNSTIQAIKTNINGIKKLSKERIFLELKKIIKLENLHIINEKNDLKEIFEVIFPEIKHLNRLNKLNYLKDLIHIDYSLKLSAILIDETNNHEYFCHKYKTSNSLLKSLKILSSGVQEHNKNKNNFEKNLRQNLYKFGKNELKKIIIISHLSKGKLNLNLIKKLLNNLDSLKIPKFKIDGDYLKSKGVVEGKKDGKHLKNIRRLLDKK